MDVDDHICSQSFQRKDDLKSSMDCEVSCETGSKQVAKGDEAGAAFTDNAVVSLPKSDMCSNGALSVNSKFRSSTDNGTYLIDGLKAELFDVDTSCCTTVDCNSKSETDTTKTEEAFNVTSGLISDLCVKTSDVRSEGLGCSVSQSSCQPNCGNGNADAIIRTHADCNGEKLGASVAAAENVSEGCQSQTRHNDNMLDCDRSLPPKAKAENFRPLGRLLHDLGLELVREQVYRGLIDIQTAKDANNRLEEHEKSQLVKLIEAHQRLTVRNAPYHLPIIRCSRCKFSAFSINGMALHRQYGSFSPVDQAAHVCCACIGGKGFQTRSAAGFVAHLSQEHKITGRLTKKPANFSCTNCPYEHRNSAKLQQHLVKCLKKYPLICNLQPLPGDCDIALIYHPMDRVRSAIQPNIHTWSISLNGTRQPSVRTLLNCLRSQQTTSIQAEAVSPTGRNLPTPPVSAVICEICGKIVDGREALWSHFRAAHHVELSRSTMKDQDPWMKCDVCNGRFWTYQGLSRHLLLAHNRAVAATCTGNSISSPAPSASIVPRCHLCGGSQTANPMSHFSAYHNITLLEMYHAKLCCLCNRKLNSGGAFEEHMVDRHSDIFANYDVLRTVLQALTAARYFKSDDVRRESSVHQDAAQTRSDARPPGVRKNAASLTRARVADKRKKEPAVATQPLVSVKASSKAATTEDVKNLYENLVDIGRPILRSMRHKLSNSAASSSLLETNESVADSVPFSSDDIPRKKTQSDDKVTKPKLTVAPAD
jgi:hypothetical protein